ncbi:MAG: sugar ABC transporter ATP-binding protein [Treponema sp.]|jgi:ribose transport system ATP-binding protein|nr:sugar ABC transporter ATP-binding protein [Treponema sp.]
MDGEVLLSLRNVTKRFPGVLALKNVSMDVRYNEALGLVGENGAGKSTLIKTITGAHAPDGGEIYFDGKKLENINPRYSMSLGIACIYQELNLVPQMTVYENIYLGCEELINKTIGLTNVALMREEAVKVLAALGLNIDPDAPAGSLGLGKQQMIEIARAIRAQSKMIIMDEPTASLSSRETGELLEIVRYLKTGGLSVIYISHRLDEVKALTDRITVMRDGQKVGTLNTADAGIDEIVRMMAGRDISRKYPKTRTKAGKELLRAEGLTRKGVIENVSFSVREGEVLGFAGLVGSGRTETMRALTGADPLDSGKIFVEGRELSIRSPRDSINAGIAFLTEDRKGQGLILVQSIEFNSTLASLENYVKACLLRLKRCKADAELMVKEMHSRSAPVTRITGNLSGGNQQKVVIAKWLLTRSKIFIIDEPTRGIDVGAKVDVYNLINRLTERGAGVIMISSDIDECIGMSDRIIVMYEGRVKAELSEAGKQREKIMFAASGLLPAGRAEPPPL